MEFQSREGHGSGKGWQEGKQETPVSLNKNKIKEKCLCINRFHSELQIRSKAIKEVPSMFEVVQIKSPFFFKLISMMLPESKLL